MQSDMKENDMLEQMFSAVAQLLGQREEALLERVAALEKRVEELEQKLQEAVQAGVPVAAAVVEEVESVVEEVFEDAAEEEEDAVEVEDDEVIEDDAIDGAVIVEDIAVEEELSSEPEMEIELEFYDEEEGEVAVEDVESGDEEGSVLVVDKARPDWYDWEVDIPGSYIEDIWDGIGLNDRLLFLKELFRGDEIDFSETLDALNEMSTLVEAVEYIRGRYSFWDEESDEVYRFYMTVRRRFNKQKQEI